MRPLLALALGLANVGCSLTETYPAADTEVCDNGTDDDLDGATDCADRACNGVAPCAPRYAWAGDAPPVEAPRMTCPSGWRSDTDPGGITTCDPYPEEGPLGCVSGWAHFSGEPACRPIGRPCATDGWPTDLPGTGVWYVRPGGTGPGTRESPSGSLADALRTAAASGGTVALAAGTYSEGAALVDGTATLRGACAADTLIQVADGLVAWVAAGATLTIEDVQLHSGGAAVGVQVAGHAALRGVLLDGAAGIGLFAYGGTARAGLDLEDVVVRNVGPNAVAGGIGIAGQTGVDLRLDHVIVEDVQIAGLAVFDALGSVTGRDVVVRRVRDGLGVLAAVPTTLSSSLIEDVVAYGLALQSSAVLEDVVVRGVAPNASTGSDGVGVQSSSAGTLEGQRLVVDDTHQVGLVVVSPAHARLEDVVIRGTRAQRVDGRFGRALVAIASGVEVTRLAIADADDVGVHATEGATLRLADVSVSSARLGGIVCDHGAAIDVRRAVVRDVEGMGLAALGRGATLVADDVLAVDVAARADGSLGYGLVAQDHAFAQLDHVRIEHVDVAGALALGDRATLLLSDAMVRSSASASVGIGGYDGADVALTRFVVEAGTACGLVATAGTTFETEAGLVRLVSSAACGDGETMPPGIAAGTRYADSGTSWTSAAPPAPTMIDVPPLDYH